MKKPFPFVIAMIIICGLIAFPGYMALTGQVKKNRVISDEATAQTIRICFNETLQTESCYKEILESSVDEIVFTDANSVEDACKVVGENFSSELKQILTELKAPISKDAKEYVVTWDISEDGELEEVECRIRLEDGTYLKNKDGEIITGVSQE